MEIHEGDEITIVFDVTPENTKIGFVGFNERGLIDIREVHAKLVSVNGKNFEDVYILRTKIELNSNGEVGSLYMEGKAGRVKVNGQDIFENPLLPYLRKIIKPIAKELASLF